jgi:hypothetical protein
MKCEVCGADAAVHIAEADLAGVQVERHLCPACAQRMGLPVSAGLADAVSRLRGLAQFCRGNNRMTSPGELRQLGGVGEMPATPPGTPEFEEQVRFLESVANFMEQHGRHPTDEELPDPFYRRP